MFTVFNSLQKQEGLKSPWQEIISEIPVLAHKIFVSDKRDFVFYVGQTGWFMLARMVVATGKKNAGHSD